MPAVNKVGIVGAGAAGLTLSVFLADAGLDVEILEKTEGPSILGSELTLQGNALRVLQGLGLWPALQSKGFSFNEIGLPPLIPPPRCWRSYRTRGQEVRPSRPLSVFSGPTSRPSYANAPLKPVSASAIAQQSPTLTLGMPRQQRPTPPRANP